MIRVAVGILRKGTSVLVCQRTPSAKYPLQWEFPGGKVEPGETAEQCLFRELDEELSVHVQIGSCIHIQQWNYPDSGSYEIHYYMIDSFEPEPHNNVFYEIRFIPVEQLHSLDMLEGNRDVISLLQSNLLKQE